MADPEYRNLPVIARGQKPPVPYLFQHRGLLILRHHHRKMEGGETVAKSRSRSKSCSPSKKPGPKTVSVKRHSVKRHMRSKPRKSC